MSDLLITSRENPAIKLATAVREGRDRDRIFIEGLRLSEEAIDANLRIETVFFVQDQLLKARGSELLDRLQSTNARIIETTSRILDGISDTKNPQGIVLVATRPVDRTLSDISTAKKPLLLAILHKVGNPANTGGILRTAEAAGVSAVLATEGTADIYSPKSLRASMGSAFRLRVIQKLSFEQAIEECRARGLAVIGTAPDADLSYTQLDWTNPTAVVLGSEAFGLDRDELNQLDRTVTVPMNPPVESLNVAATAAIIFFEAARQIRGIHRR